jgi:hypothetical protein
MVAMAKYRLLAWSAVWFIFSLMWACSDPMDPEENPFEQPQSEKTRAVIYETDMCFDVDDAGALAVLHALADNDEARILAVCFNEVHKDGAAAIDAINTWYGRGDIPVGIYKDELSAPDASRYLDALAALPNDMPEDITQVPDAEELYVSVLESQPDSSVTIISVGFLNNLGNLLESHKDLIARKVCLLVIMAGVHNDDFNLVRHDLVETSQFVFSQWPTPIVVSQPGGNIYTGESLEACPEDNPVREAYYRWFNRSFEGRSSWDQVAVLFGVKGPGYFSVESEGTGSLKNGYIYEMVPGWRSTLSENLSTDDYEYLINNLMTKTPKNKL